MLKFLKRKNSNSAENVNSRQKGRRRKSLETTNISRGASSPSLAVVSSSPQAPQAVSSDPQEKVTGEKVDKGEDVTEKVCEPTGGVLDAQSVDLDLQDDTTETELNLTPASSDGSPEGAELQEVCLC